MNKIDTFPIENFLEKAQFVLKTNQKSLILDKKEVELLYDCLAITMTRLAGSTSSNPVETQKTSVSDNIQIKMDGGLF